MKLTDKLDVITRQFWETWKVWRVGQGWTFGSDLPSQKLSPNLKESFDSLPPEGSEWFRQHAALVLWALDQLPLEQWGFTTTRVKPEAPAVDAAAPRHREEAVRLRKDVEDLRALVRLREMERDEALASTNKAEAPKADDDIKQAAQSAVRFLRGRHPKEALEMLLRVFPEMEPEAPAPDPTGDGKPRKKKSSDWGQGG